MYHLAAIVVLVPFVCADAKDKAGDFDACKRGRTEVARRAADFQGEERIRRLIQADLKRAANEDAEGDTEECLEALEHANKLIAGQY